MYLVLGVLAIAYGIILIIRPETEYELFEWWKSDGGEPSDFYLKVTKISAYVGILLGIALIIYQLFFFNQ